MSKSIKYNKGEIKFSISNQKNKKYKAVHILPSGKIGHTTHFGDKRYEHYKDTTPLKAYTDLDHLDKERRERYRKRHSKIKLKDGRLAFKVPFTSAWFSWRYLW